ncbi:hypothetical protein HK101_007054 [Irineochytrium annulatum]|nr:hypothetical protein HK101_007054 [Irineochytrium annulatum]
MNSIRRKVSEKRRRLVNKALGTDLDLTYITPNLIAMGYPSENIEGLYRNRMKDVIRFLETVHKDKYKVYNLCSEKSYPSSRFHDRGKFISLGAALQTEAPLVASFPFRDHQAPPMSTLIPFCEDVESWLTQQQPSSSNVAVIHCKAGKGRTGVMICCYLLYSGACETADDAMRFYGEMRTIDGQGVTIRSQRRYIRYFEELLKSHGRKYIPRPLLLRKIRILDPPTSTERKWKFAPKIQIRNGQGDVLWESTAEYQDPDQATDKNVYSLNVSNEGLRVVDDIKIDVIYRWRKVGPKSIRRISCWLNTAFVNLDDDDSPGVTTLTRSELDKAKWAELTKEFKIQFEFGGSERQPE